MNQNVLNDKELKMIYLALDCTHRAGLRKLDLFVNNAEQTSILLNNLSVCVSAKQKIKNALDNHGVELFLNDYDMTPPI